MHEQFSEVGDAITAIATGQMVIVLDSEDRENEGDLVMAAEKVTPETIHFMISEGRGQLCIPILDRTARRLGLKQMVAEIEHASMPRFTVPVDHRNCKTGISPLERTVTIQAIVNPQSQPADFVRPGHVFPLVARQGGVMERPGHTEAAVDLARLAGLAPAGVLCEICSRDGLHMAECAELLQLATDFGLPVITIDALIRYRRQQAPKPAATQGEDVLHCRLGSSM